MVVKKFTSKMLIPILTAAMAVVFIVLGLTKYGFWDASKGPMPGFFPVIIGCVLVAVSALAFFQSFKEEGTSYPIANWFPALGAVALLLVSLVIGMIPAIAIYVIVWLRWYEKCAWKTTLITFAIVMAIVIGAFVLWLGVPFPKGLIYDLIFNR